MFTSTTQIRVRYAETDKMGYVYYGNYAQYYEVGRVEGLRDLGLSYRAMEDAGILLPVMEYQIKYFKPAYYDDLLTIKTTILELKGARIFFEYETLNQQGRRDRDQNAAEDRNAKARALAERPVRDQPWNDARHH